MSSFKVCLVGPSKSGKTHFMSAFVEEDKDIQNIHLKKFHDILRMNIGCKKYHPTLGVGIELFTIGDVQIDMRDTGSGKYVGQGVKYTKGANGIIQFHNDAGDPPPFEVAKNLPIVHVYGFKEGDEIGILRSLIQLMD